MYLSHEQVAASGSVQTDSALTVPANASHAELQATSQNIRYTMDGTSDPSSSVGMVLLATEPPKTFIIDDVRRIRFIQEAAGADLELHYIGRNI